MAQLQIPCPSCKTSLNVTDALMGKPIQCPSCKHPFIVGGANPIGAPSIPGPALAELPADELALQSPDHKDGGGPVDPTSLEKCPFCGVAWKKGSVDCKKCNYNVITQRRMKRIGGGKRPFTVDTTKLFIYAAIFGVIFGIYWLGTNFDWLRRSGTEMYDNAARGTPTESDGAAMKRKESSSDAGKVKD